MKSNLAYSNVWVERVLSPNQYNWYIADVSNRNCCVVLQCMYLYRQHKLNELKSNSKFLLTWTSLVVLPHHLNGQLNSVAVEKTQQHVRSIHIASKKKL